MPRVCLKTGEMSDFCPKTRAFKEKTARKACRLSRIFDAESTVLGQNRRRFGVLKQTLDQKKLCVSGWTHSTAMMWKKL